MVDIGEGENAQLLLVLLHTAPMPGVAQRFRRSTRWCRVPLLLFVLALALTAFVTASSATPSRLIASGSITPLAPICPTILQSWGAGQSCFPQNNGNQSQSASGTGEIAGATLGAPAILQAGPCPADGRFPKNAWCTQPFTLSLSVPGMGAAKYVNDPGVLGQPLVGTSITRPGARPIRVQEGVTYGDKSGSSQGGASWCKNQLKGPGFPCPSHTQSDSLRVWGNSDYSTIAVCALGLLTLLNQQITAYTEYWPFVLGTILIVLLFVFPGGILGALDALVTRMTKRRHA